MTETQSPYTAGDDEHTAFVENRIEEFRKQLLGLNLRNPFLHCPHTSGAATQLRVVDALPDTVFQRLKDGKSYAFRALPEPQDSPVDEDTEKFRKALDGFKRNSALWRSARKDEDSNHEQLEREARDHIRQRLGLGVWQPERNLPPDALLRQHGVNPDYELSSPGIAPTEDSPSGVLQTKLAGDDLDMRLRRLRDRSNSSISQTGVGILFACFGFLEWFENGNSNTPHLAPLVMAPVKLARMLDSGKYVYKISKTEDDIFSNITLQEYFAQQFNMQMPSLGENDTPETFFSKISDLIGKHQPRWRVRRFITIGLFGYSKLAIYKDLDIGTWPKMGGLATHRDIRTLMAGSEVSSIPYAHTREIDKDETVETAVPLLVLDADSSQHSSIADAMEGRSLTIVGPPGTGKSQTIANLIASAIAAGKTILFVAEKQTALNVVYDRMEVADIHRFCLYFHAQQSNKEFWESLDERIKMSAPAFEPTQYERRKTTWMQQRDALRRYTEVIGDRVGQLRWTVHDILWRDIELREVEPRLPPGVATAGLSDVERVLPDEIEEARNRIDRLAESYATVQEMPYFDGRTPWRGVKRAHLSPVDRGDIIRRIGFWMERLQALEQAALELGASAEAMTPAALEILLSGLGLLRGFPGIDALCDLSFLAAPEARQGVARMVGRQDRLDSISEALEREYGLDIGALPDAGVLRRFAAEGTALGVSDESLAALASQAREMRDAAGRRQSIDEVLERLRAGFGIEEETGDCDEAIDRATGLLSEAEPAVLAARCDALIEGRAGLVLDRAEREVRDLERLGEKLRPCFDLDSLPDPSELRRDAMTLRALRGPAWLSRPARQALRRHRTLALKRAKVKPEDAAADLRLLAGWAEARARLADDAEFREFFGARWKGADTDLSQDRPVVEWVARVRERLAGEGSAWAAARRALFHGEFDQLADAGKTAAALPPDWRCVRAGPQASETRTRAARLETLLEDCRTTGLDDAASVSQAATLADLIEEHDRLAAEAEEDDIPAQAFRSPPPDRQTLDAVYTLCSAMTERELPDEAWKRVAIACAQIPAAEDAHRLLEESLAQERDAWSECAQMLEIDECEFFDGNGRAGQSIPSMMARARECREAEAGLLPWSAYVGARAAVERSHAGPVLAAFDEQQAPPAQLREAYDWQLCHSLAKIVFKRHPELRGLTGAQLRNHREAFQSLENELQRLERSRIAYRLYSQPVAPGEREGGPGKFTENALIQHQLNLSRKNITPRNLIARSGTALRQLKPCFMMSPLAVARLLPRDVEPFDIVIIDEASQMLPCDAFGTIARGRQTVIVGDPKQLPPTTFFQGGGIALAGDGQDDGDDDGIIVAGSVESILDQSLAAWRPPRDLRWHYRSRHSRLIQFSNDRFYDNRLIVFPGPDEGNDEYGVHYHYVDNGLYGNSRNRVEAEAVVEAACAFMENPENREHSLAIVAINQPQRDLIDEFMDRETVRRPAVRQYRHQWRDTLYPFIVRNLETVQGDERDVVFISTVYGRETTDGPVRQRFGPIVQTGGERRLNVLFTRARRRIDLFSSMRANDIAAGPGVSEGARVLRDYLEYAATGRLETGVPQAVGPESPFEEHVLKRLRARNLEVVPQVGVAGYRIDLGIRHPAWPHGYLLGIECDGATYHSAPSVRDRDRLRETVLRDLGWDIVRIWSTDWFNDPDAELDRVLAYIEAKVEKFREESDLEQTESAEPRVTFEAGHEGRGNRLPRDQNELFEDETYIEVGDTVFYHSAEQDLDIHSVRITQDFDDPENGVISVTEPLAAVLLGATVGDIVTVPTSGADIVITGIEPPEA